LNDNIIEIGNTSKYEFAFVSVWSPSNLFENGERQKKQQAVIVLRNKEKQVHVVHPFANFINHWKWAYKSYNTQKKHAGNIIQFLNFVLVRNNYYKIKSFKELSKDMAIDYLNMLNVKELKRSTIVDYRRTIKEFYRWMEENDITKKAEISSEEMDTNNTFHVILPEKEKLNKLHNLPINYIPLFLEIAKSIAHPIALGIYMQIFGGIRCGEAVNIVRTSIKRSIDGKSMTIHLKENNFRTDLKDLMGSNYVKKNRKQLILSVNNWGIELFNNHINSYSKKDIGNTGALFINRDGRPMSGSSYSYYFKKVKNAFISFLEESDEVNDRILALNLRNSNWLTHIGRGTFTNLIAEEIENPAELMFLRGDSSLESALPYLTKTERVRSKVEEKMNEMQSIYIPKTLNKKTNLT